MIDHLSYLSSDCLGCTPSAAYCFVVVPSIFWRNSYRSSSVMPRAEKWTPEEGLTVHAFPSSLEGNAGYVLVEASDPKVVTSFLTKYNFWNDIHVVPVIDTAGVVPIVATSVPWAWSASKS